MLAVLVIAILLSFLVRAPGYTIMGFGCVPLFATYWFICRYRLPKSLFCRAAVLFLAFMPAYIAVGPILARGSS